MSFISNYIDRRVANFFENMDLKIDITGKIYNDELYELQENRIWYKANKDTLLRFYKTTRRTNQLYPIQDFYRLAPGTIPIEHYPLADMITKTMVNLIFSEKPAITIQTGNKNTDAKLNKVIDKIYNDNKIASMLQKAAELESYSGAVAFKPILDSEFSEYPILMVYPKEEIDIVKKYDRIQAILFKDYYKDKNKKYVLYTECGIGYIDYKLYSIGENGKEDRKPVSLDSIPQTTGLERKEFFTKDGRKLKQLMAVYKENKTNAISDYSGIIDDFQALDEIYSNMINYIRKSKVKVYMPENMCKKDLKGETIVPFEYDSDYTILYDSNPDGTKQEAKRDVIDIQNTVNGYITAFNEVIKHAVLNTGLSLSSIGYDISGANASGEALSIREKVSMRTRSEKIHLWDEALQSLTKLVLSLSTYALSGEKIFVDDMLDTDILVSFAEYESPSFDSVVASLITAKDGGLIDLDTALHRLWDGEYSEDEISLMKFNIENQLSQNTQIVDNELVDTEDETILQEDK